MSFGKLWKVSRAPFHLLLYKYPVRALLRGESSFHNPCPLYLEYSLEFSPRRIPNTSFGLIIWDCREQINWESGWVCGTLTSGHAALSSHTPPVFWRRHEQLSPKKMVLSPCVSAVRDSCLMELATGVSFEHT